MTGIPLSDERIPHLRSLYDRCFGCGSQNPIGLHLDDFTETPDGVTALFTPGSNFNGFHGVVHGGVIATALDEISAWSAIVTEGVFVFTAKLDIRYRAEAKVGSTLSLTGSVTERRGKRLLIDAVMKSGEAVAAQSSGLFVVADTVDNLLEASGGPTAR
ncbi:MAG: PaaI family thioesterase [Actinomycetota bacterium]